ncbi:MAG: glycosyltransferase family 4 protein [Bacteroidales bacterium]|nr:glycosyltransferase family 4 protein [Bacteroidales bacterium]
MADEKRGTIVGFDAKRLTRNRTGLGNYSRFVAESLAVYAPEIQQVHSSSSIGEPGLYERLKAYPSFHLLMPKVKGLPFGDYVWRNFTSRDALLRRDIRLFHGLSNELPKSIRDWGIPGVVTMHDLIYEIFPRYYTPIDASLYHEKYLRSCGDADCIVAVSECTKRDLMRIYGLPEDKIRVIYQGCNPVFGREIPEGALERVRVKYRLPKQFILSVGTIEERKNALRLVEALSLVQNKRIDLVLVGRETKYTAKVLRRASELKVSDRVRVLSSVPFGDLPAFYRLADTFAFPSLYEGFGIPVLEALNSGVPVVAATGSCLEEAGGPASLYANPYDPSDLAGKLDAVPDKRQRMIEAGKSWATRFLPEKLGTEMADLYRELIFPTR